jgi:carbamoylphosphate synthase large subunit
MIIIFFGLHNKDWMDVLNDKLIKYFPDDTNITKITNIYDVNKLINTDLSSTYIIPLMENHMIELHNNNIKALMPSIENIKFFSCKKEFALFVKNNNLEQYAPKVYNSIDEIPINGLYIIKPYNLNNGNDICIKQYLDKTDFDNKIVQEYIYNKKEYSSYFVSKNGYIIKCITYEFIFDNDQHIKSFPINTQNMTKIDLDYKYIKQLELFLICCKYTGICNIDFVICNDQIKVFEINPRLGGGLIRINRCDLIEMLNEMIKLNE